MNQLEGCRLDATVFARLVRGKAKSRLKSQSRISAFTKLVKEAAVAESVSAMPIRPDIL